MTNGYPCGCTPSEVTYPPDNCSAANCLRVPNITIDTDDSVGPCGGVGSADFGALSTLTACDGSIIWQLLPGWDTDAFSDASIDSSGVLSFTTTAEAVVGRFYEFVIKVMCSNSILSVQRKLRVPIRNLCETTVCAEFFHCNPCTGGCISDTIDLILT